MRKSFQVFAFVASLGIAASTFAGDEVQWKHVQRMDPGTRITVTVDGAAPVERYFVQLRDAELIVLNLSAPDVPRRQLLNMAKDNPQWMSDTSKTTYKDNDVRVGPDGVFVKEKKVAGLDEVVEHIPRARVSALKG